MQAQLRKEQGSALGQGGGSRSKLAGTPARWGSTLLPGVLLRVFALYTMGK